MTFLQAELEMDDEFMTLVDFTVSRYRTPRSKVVNEALVTFNTVENRDMVKAAGPALTGKANMGVRIHIPRHLQEDFKALDNVSYELKENYKDL